MFLTAFADDAACNRASRVSPDVGVVAAAVRVGGARRDERRARAHTGDRSLVQISVSRTFIIKLG